MERCQEHQFAGRVGPEPPASAAFCLVKTPLAPPLAPLGFLYSFPQPSTLPRFFFPLHQLQLLPQLLQEAIKLHLISLRHGQSNITFLIPRHVFHTSFTPSHDVTSLHHGPSIMTFLHRSMSSTSTHVDKVFHPS